MDEDLLARVEDHVLWLTLNRPDARNATATWSHAPAVCVKPGTSTTRVMPAF